MGRTARASGPTAPQPRRVAGHVKYKYFTNLSLPRSRLALPILVTGGSGFIGPKLVGRLVEGGEVVRILDNLSGGSLANISAFMKTGAVEFIEADVRDAGAVAAAAEGCSLIYHLAGQSSVPVSTEKPILDMEVNINGTLNVLMAAKEARTKVVFASSSTVYGMAARTPTPEDAPLVPRSFYGLSKMTAEHYCRIFSELFGVPTVSLRLFNVYGPGTNKGVMIDLYRKLRADPGRLEVLGTGMQKKDYLYIDDVVEAFIAAAERAPCRGEAYNIGSGKSYTVFEIVERMFAVLGLSGVEVRARGGIAWPGDVELTQPDITKAELEFGWRPRVGIGEGLRKTLEWFGEVLGPVSRARQRERH